MTAFGSASPVHDARGGATDVPAEARSARRRRLGRLAAVAALATGLGVPAVVLVRGSGLVTAVMRRVAPAALAPAEHPWVAVSRPSGNDGAVPCDAFVAADVSLPNAGHGIDPATIDRGSVRLVRKGDNSVVPARVNTSAAGDAIVLQPDRPLEPNAAYRFEVLPALKDTAGKSFKPFSATFTTAARGHASALPVAFEKVELPETAGRVYTSVAVGPDGRLYAGTYDGTILRCDLSADGAVAAATEINTVRTSDDGPRLITGLCFDPAAPADRPVVYVSHGQSTRTAAQDWSGKLSRLSGPNLADCRDVLVGLPRASRDHLNSQLAFGPDGALYMSQGSNSAMGAPDGPWGNRPERKLSAAILRIDVAKLSAGPSPLDVKTEAGGSYDPDAAGAAVTLYATGLRNAYDLVWHRNGRLYAPINGSAAGGNTPADPARGVPGLRNVRLTIPDHLAVVRPGGYHGHPNPTRGQYVLMGGNPTSGPDPVEVGLYPAGTRPDANWVPPALEFGRNLAPCGILDYRGAGPAASLDGALFVCRFSGGKDVCVVTLNPDGSAREMITGIDGLTRFADPLDIAQHPGTGHLYVAEYGGKRVTLVRAVPGSQSAQVYRQPVHLAHPPIHEAHPAAHVVPGGHDDD